VHPQCVRADIWWRIQIPNGSAQYEAAFRENEIDETVLPSLTHETLKELGVASVGHRVKLLDAIAALRTYLATKPRQSTRLLNKSSLCDKATFGRLLSREWRWTDGAETLAEHSRGPGSAARPQRP
jgi:hypothetical protein